jgi:hypothetical protein
MQRFANAPQIASRLRLLLGIRGSDPARELDDTLLPVVVTESPRLDTEAAGGYTPWLAWINQAAGGAGFFNHGLIFNPFNSGIVVVVEGFRNNGVLSQWRAGIRYRGAAVSPPAGFTQSLSFHRDSLLSPSSGGSPAPVQVWQVSDVTANYHTTPFDLLRIATEPQPERPAFVLRAGSALTFDSLTANVATELLVWGYARSAFIGERDRGPGL